MVETEKVCNHKISTATTTSELVQRTKSVGENSSGNNNHVKDGGSRGGGTGTRKSYGSKEDFGRWNSIATGNNIPNGSSATAEYEGSKGHRGNLERSMSAYYVFSSLPKVVHNVRPKTGYRNNVSRPRGAHDYFNVMWDPHIYRGTTTTLTSSLKQPETATDLTSSNRDQQDRYRRRRAFLQGSQNTFNTSTNTSSLTPMGGVGGGGSTTIRSNRYKMTTKVTSRSRTFPPPEGRHQVHVQTEEYLEDLSRDVTRGPDKDAIVQTDPIEDEELISSPLVNPLTSSEGNASKGKMLPAVAGVDASTQVLPGELITFDERVQPVVEAVVGKILEQALLETMEEEEIGALKAQQNRFLEKRKEEERELKRLQEQQERISAEKERLKRHLEMQFKQRQLQQQQQQPNGGESVGEDSSGTSGGGDDGDEVDVVIYNNTMTAGGGSGNINGGVMSTAYLLELLPSVLNSLRQEGFLVDDQSGDEVLSSYVPLWQQQPSSNSSKPDEDENSTSVYNDNNNVDGDMMTVENNEDGDAGTLDGCQSRSNTPEIEGEATAAEEESCEKTQGEDEVMEEQQNAEDENCDSSGTGEEMEKNTEEQVVEPVEENAEDNANADDEETLLAAEGEEAAVAEESEEAAVAEESEEAVVVEENEEAAVTEESEEAAVAEESADAEGVEESEEAAAVEESEEAAAVEESDEAVVVEANEEAVGAEESEEAAEQTAGEEKENEEAEEISVTTAESEECGDATATVDNPEEEGLADNDKPDTEGGESESAMDKEEGIDIIVDEDTIVMIPSGDEKEKEEEGNNNEIAEEQMGKGVEANPTTETTEESPEALSSSQKLPNGAIPSVL